MERTFISGIIFLVTNLPFNALAQASFITRWSTQDGSITIPTAGAGYNYYCIMGLTLMVRWIMAN